MIFAQHGPAWKPKLERLFSNDLIDGVIWDPREEKVDRIKEIRNNDHNYSLVQNVVDLKIYYKQFESSIVKRLSELDYFPKSNIDRAFLRNTENLETLVSRSIDFQLEFDVDVVMAPSFYLYSFNDRIVDKLFDTWEIFYDQLQDNGIDKNKFVSIIFNETALENKSYISDFLDDFSDISQKFDGIYITIDREKVKHRHDFNPNRLNGMLQFIYDLKNLGLKVVIGYSGIESVLYFAVGANAIGTGWFYSLRNFNREQKGLEPVESMGRQKKRYTSMSMLYELAIEDEIFSIPKNLKEELYEKILTGCELDSKVNEGNIENINFNDMYQQYFEAMKQVVDEIKKKNKIEEKVKLVNQLLDTADTNIKRYNELETLQNINGKHIKNYKIALNKFQEDNFIFV
ncbi:hypothetical protein [Lentibacillus sp. Marseille-P4043]|uniref:hypothetical protein n=1 Tax=Lentibacillus sp. Marseille-P4043 TaxID=2040293 RepID=UPI000D0BB573|nr:hypothetical protein [Lentibacillus sp. Marseille-P4043]